MRRIRRSIRKRYSCLRLDKDDLYQLHGIVTASLAESKTEADEYELSTINDLEGINKERIERFKIVGYNPDDVYGTYVSVEIYNPTAYVYASDRDNVTSIGIFTRLDNILSKRVPRLFFR